MADPASRADTGIPDADRRILRELGRRKAEIAALPIQDERRGLWSDLNQLRSRLPMVWLFEVPWHELGDSGELALRCESRIGRNLEQMLRRELYQWDHMQGDMVVEPAIEVPPAVRDTGLG